MITFITCLGMLSVVGIGVWHVHTRQDLTRRQKAATLLISMDIGGTAGCLIFAVINLLMRLTMETGTTTFLALGSLSAVLTLVAVIIASPIVARLRVKAGRLVALWGMLLSGTGLFAAIPMAVTLALPVLGRFSWLLVYVTVTIPLAVLVGIGALCSAVWFLSEVPTRLLVWIALLPVVVFLAMVSVFVILVR